MEIILPHKMKRLRGAVIGLGYWGPNIIRNLLKIDQVEVAFGCDISLSTIRKFNEEFPTIPTTRDVKKILTDPSISFVIIATPLETHFDLARSMLLTNKHVLLEKPMTQTSSQARTLIKLAQKQRKILMVGHTFVYSEAVQRIKKLIRKNSFGALSYYDSTRINLGRIQSNTNVIWDLAPHDFSILDALIPYKPLSIQAMGSSPVFKKHLEHAHIFLTYEHHFTAHIHVSWLSPVKIRTILLGGTGQMIQYNDIEPSEKVRIYNKSISFKPGEVTPFTPAYRSGSVIIPHLAQKEALLTELEHFVSCIKHNKKPLTSGEEGLKVIQLLEATDRALVSNKVVNLIK